MLTKKDHRDRRGTGRSASKAPGAVQSGIALVLSVLVAALALNVSQAPPPAIAEFSPSAVEQVETAEEQAGAFGAGGGGGGTGEGGALTGTGPSTTTTTASATPEQVIVEAEIVKSRQKRCVGDPPRQIEDPQSPPCIDYFDGDNGGATTRGVTANEVRVAVIEATVPKEALRAYQSFFNNRFQLYGRKITFTFIGGPQPANPTQEKAAAHEVAQKDVFAALGGSSIALSTYFRELAAKQILSVGYYPYFTSSELASMRPYVWQYRSAPDVDFSMKGQWACKRLAGRPARHASGVNDAFVPPQELQSQTRKFAVYYSRYYPGDEYGPGDLVDSLASCGVQVDPDLVFRRDARATYATNPGDPVNQSDVQKMKSKGVTTVLCVCHLFSMGSLMGAATSQRWFPEWTGHTFGGQDWSGGNRQYLAQSPNQRRQLFGLSAEGKAVPMFDHPLCVALREQGEECPSVTTQNAGQYLLLYEMLLLLASGIQMAGPNLTPESFEKGLRTAVFPNPPYYTMPPRVGFATGYAMQRGDVVEWYWRDGARGAGESAVGNNCYVNGGRRYDRHELPGGPDQFFPPDDGNGANCDTGANPKRE